MHNTNELLGSVEDLHRKLRAIAAVAEDPDATEHERATAQEAAARLKRQLRDAGAPAEEWTDNLFRLCKWTKRFRKSASPASLKQDRT
jgi:hypothetical protein